MQAEILYTVGMVPLTASLALYFVLRGAVSTFLTLGWRKRETVGLAGGRDVLRFLWIAYIGLIALILFSGIRPSIAVPAVTLLAFGTALRFWAMFSLGSWYAPDVRVYVGQPVIHSGPYVWLRHPLYLGLSLEACALGFLCASWAGPVLAFAVVTLTQIQNRRERPLLTRALGDPYVRHCLATWDIEDWFTPRPANLQRAER
jgi:methyltransferase